MVPTFTFANLTFGKFIKICSVCLNISDDLEYLVPQKWLVKCENLHIKISVIFSPVQAKSTKFVLYMHCKYQSYSALEVLRSILIEVE